MTTEYRLMFRLHAGTSAYKRKIVNAQQIIEQSLTMGSTFVSVSGGKDSVALIGLARSIDHNIPAYHIDSGAETDDTKEVISILISNFNVQTIIPELSIVEMCEQVGMFGYDGANKLDGEWHWQDRQWKDVLLAEPTQRLVDQCGYRVMLTGVRADESNNRKIRSLSFGAIHKMKCGVIHSWPLAGWTGMDSLAYCESNSLPISKVYLREGREPPQIRRTGTALGAINSTKGRFADLRKNSPKQWAELADKFPDIRKFS